MDNKGLRKLSRQEFLISVWNVGTTVCFRQAGAAAASVRALSGLHIRGRWLAPGETARVAFGKVCGPLAPPPPLRWKWG